MGNHGFRNLFFLMQNKKQKNKNCTASVSKQLCVTMASKEFPVALKEAVNM